MSNRKRKVSNRLMLFILFFMTIRQMMGYSEFSFVKASSLANDLVLLSIILFVTVLLSVLVIYLPLLVIVKLRFDLHFNLISFPSSNLLVKRYFRNTRYTRGIFRKLNVIRC